MKFEMFPEEYVALNRELASGLHPRLTPILAKTHPDDIDMRIAHTASYCSVMLDGTYTLEDRIKLCHILTEKLVLLRERPPTIILS